MKSSLMKYRVGLLVLVVLVFGLVAFVAMGAGDHKADLETKKAADKVAEQLNNYVLSSSSVPESLAEADVKNVPDTVKYTKQSDTKYRFCVTYKAANSGFDPNTAVQEAAIGLSMGSTGGDFSMADSGYLYLDSNHKKGENCQTVTLPDQNTIYDDTPTPGLEYSPPLDYNPDGTDPGLLTQPQELPDSYEYPVQ